MIIREKRRKGSFACVSKQAVNDPGLSLAAKGLILYAMDHAHDWDLVIDEITSHCLNGRDSVRAVTKELIEKGYMQESKRRSIDGRVSGFARDVSDAPIFNNLHRSPETGNQFPVDGEHKNAVKKSARASNKQCTPETGNQFPVAINNKEDLLFIRSQCDQVSSEAKKPREASEIWRAALNMLERDINRSSFNTWIRPLSFEFDALHRPCLICSDETSLFWVSSQWVGVIAEALSSVAGETITKEELIFSIREGEA